MAKAYSVTYKVAGIGADYIYQEDKADHEAGDLHDSPGGHMWYGLSNGDVNNSYGFASVRDEMSGPGKVVRDDYMGCQQMHGFGAQIIRDDLTRHGSYYDDGQSCLWLGVNDLKSAGPTTNDFALNTDLVSGIKYKKSVDHDAAAAQVSNGLITSGGGWNLNYDPNKLNLNQYQGNWINNTFTAAATQILADGYRPGNANTVKDVFDFSLRTSSQSLSYGSTLAALLNSSDARARLTRINHVVL
ncbi:hypothetical protein [Pseudomonas sp. FEN]|uniref:hypothetical protein n=1 Tax=Pseudomonas sp. FEN TaxID=2767468 RepID=UPI00174AE90E|nr:hypothetical protein [Pseudomonas sp. FEN]